MTQKTKSTIKRFIKGLIAGFLGGAIMVQFQDYATIEAYLNAVLVAGASGLLLAVQKYLSWKD